MSFLEILLLAFALSIDACVVSFSYGLIQSKNIIKWSLILALFTGGFQAFMPFLGGICTDCVRYYIQPYAKWIIFVIFLYLGINFIKEALNKDKDNDSKKDLTYIVVLMIAIATSIDAFSAGISLSLKLNSITIPILTIGIITFINSLVGFYGGRTFKKFEPKCLELLGGAILILLAIKVVL